MRLSETWGVCSQTQASSSIKKAWFRDCINSSIAARRYSQVLLWQTSGGHQAAGFRSLPLFRVGVQGAGRGTELCYGREGGVMADLFMTPLWWDTSWQTPGSVLVYGRADSSSSHWVFPQHAAMRQVCLGSCPLLGADRHSPPCSSGWLSCCDFFPSNSSCELPGRLQPCSGKPGNTWGADVHITLPPPILHNPAALGRLLRLLWKDSR